MSPVGLPQNLLMPAAGQSGLAPSPIATQQGGMSPNSLTQAQQSRQLPPLPKPAPSPALLKTAINTGKLVLSELIQIANDPQLISDPDKLQKALLGLAADAHRSAGKDAPPVAASLAHVLSVMNDSRGPKIALRDKIAAALQDLSNLDSYSRQKHGTPGLAPSGPQQSPGIGE